MFFVQRIAKGCTQFPWTPSLRKTSYILACLLFISASTLQANNERITESSSYSEFIPIEWQESIFMPSLTSTIEIISLTSAASGTPGNTDYTIRYTIKNSGADTLNCVQINFDLAFQIGTPPFVSLTGSLVPMTGSGYILNPPLTGSMAMILGGKINHDYDGMTNDSLFSMRPTLAPDECIAIDIPFEISDTNGLDPLVIQADLFAKDELGTPLIPLENIDNEPFTLFNACESESLACAGEVNVSLGPDCTALIEVSTVFLNNVLDPNRYSVEVFVESFSVGDMLDDSHLGKTITYRVLDGCFDGRVSCWGKINLENKNIPDTTSTYQKIFCSEEPEPLPSLTEIILQKRNECSVPLSNFTELEDIVGSTCGGYIRTRTILADYEIDGWKTTATVHIDTIEEMPLDLDLLCSPLGGPDKEDAIYVNCDSIGPDGLTPGFIEDYFNSLPSTTGSGSAFAYPHFKNGFTTMEMYDSRDTIVVDTVPMDIVIGGVLVEGALVVTKDTITITDTTTIRKPVYVPVKEGVLCNFTTSYVDSYYAGCNGPEGKLLRSWKILDWCTGRLESLDQWIIIHDERGPDIEMPEEVSIGIIPWTCIAEYQLEATVSDNCSEIDALNWWSSAGVIGEDLVLREIGVEDSPITITHQAVDACGNSTVDTLILHVVDSIPPVIVTRDRINTSLTYDPIKDQGIAKITVENIDQGSHDHGCGEVNLCLILEEEFNNPIWVSTGVQATDDAGNLLYHAAQCEYDGIYDEIYPYVICKEAVKFCCDQIGEHKVMALGEDESEFSVRGIGWTTVVVEDKTVPEITCEDIEVVCGTNIDPSEIGYPQVTGGLCNDASLTYSDSGTTDECGRGDITRAWLVNGDTICLQTISFTSVGSFDPYSIKWPKHYDDTTSPGFYRECVDGEIVETAANIPMGQSFTCSDDALDTPIWCNNETCGLIVMSFEDLEVEAGDACQKIIRQWTVIDWCNYRPNSNSPDDDDDQFEAVDDDSVVDQHLLANLKDGDDCISCDKPSRLDGDNIFFRYTDVDIDYFYTFEQIIKVNDDTPPVVDAPEEVVVEIYTGATFKGDDFDDCYGSVEVTADAIELCGDIVLQENTVSWVIQVFDEDGNLLNSKETFGNTASINSTPGFGGTEHTIVWTITDGCGNTALGQTIVSFEDVKDPSPLCISELSTATMALDGTVTIWASDYDHGSYDNCSEVKFFFKNELGFNTPSLTLTCDDIPNGIFEVIEMEVFVADEAGNESSCNVTIRVDDTDDVCEDDVPGMASISGNVMTRLGDMVEAATVELNIGSSVTTDVSGTYSFSNIPMAYTYKVSAEKDDDPLNGVSTLDLVLIQRHILALDTFDTASKYIAADITNDEKVSANDLVQLRRLILGITSDFPNNTSWRFIDPDQDYGDQYSPWPFTEEIIINDLLQDQVNQDLLAVKIGDVSGNAIANSLIGQNRNTNQLHILVEDKSIKAGEQVVIPMQLNDEIDLTAMQFTLEMQGLRFVDIRREDVNVSEEHLAVHGSNNISLAWSDIQGVANPNTLFSLEVEAERDVVLSEVLSITDEITMAEAYNTSYTPFDISVEFYDNNIDATVLGDFKLYQNEPNPFSDNTKIGFSLPEDSEVQLNIFDLSGRNIYNLNKTYPAGYNQINVDAADVGMQGVLYYRLSTNQHSITKKMIIVE